MTADPERREAQLRRVAARQGLQLQKRRARVVADDISPAPKVAQIPTVKAGMHACGGCPARWGGLNTAHCPACHATFTTVANFDSHRAGSHDRGARHCVPPATVGLVDAGRAYPCWMMPGHEEREGHE